MAQNNQTQDLINFLIDSLRNYSYNNGYTTSYSTPTSSYSTYTSDDDYDIKKQKRRFYEEELHQDILDARQRNRFLEAYKKETNGAGMLGVTEMLGSIVFLLSDASKYVTGQNIIVDDGFSL